jgi:hypothetical protein
MRKQADALKVCPIPDACLLVMAQRPYRLLGSPETRSLIVLIKNWWKVTWITYNLEYGVHGSPALDESSATGNSSSGAPYSREECCVSLAGCAAMFRPAVSGLKLHVDLVPELEGSDFGAVQCAYNMYPVEVSPNGSRANAGFVCVVGSHKMYQKMWADRMQQPGYKPPTKHWHVLLEEDSPLQDQAVLVTSPANCLVLWRSDVLHKNYGGGATLIRLKSPPPTAPPRLLRLTQFVTFMPKRFRTAKSLQCKTQSVLDGCGNNHWAALTGISCACRSLSSMVSRSKENPQTNS